MKKMKKMLLTATLLVAISATAAATGNTASATLSVSANYVTPIAISLDTETLDFKDVYVGSTIAKQDVVASITGDAGETFSYEVTTTADKGVILSDASGTGTISDGAATFTFGVNMDSDSQHEDVTNQVVTVTVTYTSIDDTVIRGPIPPKKGLAEGN